MKPMGMHGGWFGLLNATDEKPKVTWALLRRVLTYSLPYRWQIIGMLAAILASTGLALLTPLILRTLIDQTIPQQRPAPARPAGARFVADPGR